MKELTREQLQQEMKKQKHKMQLKFVNDLLDKMEHLANLTNQIDYDSSYEHEENRKILQIKRYADTILNNINK